MILVVSSQQSYAANRLVEEGGSLVKIIDMAELVACNFVIDIKKFNALYIRNPYLNGSPEFLPKVIGLAKQFKAAGKKVVDGNIVDGKLGLGKHYSYQALVQAGLPIPKIFNKSFLRGHAKVTYNFPLIAKWVYGFQAKDVFLVENENQLKKLIPHYPKGQLLVQAYVKADFEYKVIAVGYKSLPVVLRFRMSRFGFKINHNEYEVLRADDAMEVVLVAEQAARVLGRELSKIDIIEKDGLLYILEANRVPGFESFEKLTKFNVAKTFLEYLQKN